MAVPAAGGIALEDVPGRPSERSGHAHDALPTRARFFLQSARDGVYAPYGLFDGEFRHTHPVNRGYRTHTGPAALVRVRRIVHTRIGLLHDPALYLALGVATAAFDVVQAKSHLSFRAGSRPSRCATRSRRPKARRAPISRACPYRRRPVPLYPFEDSDPL
jgi:hypothetical protein